MMVERQDFIQYSHAEGAIDSGQSDSQAAQSGQNPGYEAAIRKIVPETLFKQAADIVKSYKPIDPRLKNLNVLAMAKVLVVEDDEDWADIHSRKAARVGHEVITAISVEKAKKVLEENGIDLVITDGLEGKWTQVHDLAKEKGIKTVVVSSNMSIEKEAEKREVKYLYKGGTDLSTELTDTFGSI
jgi:CheY-like chemotaxis protein